MPENYSQSTLQCNFDMIASSRRPLGSCGSTHIAFRNYSRRTKPFRQSIIARNYNVSPKRLSSNVKLGVEITYQHEEAIDYDEVSLLLQKVDWPPRRQTRMQTAVENSFFLATLRAHHSPDNVQLIGFARIVSDGAFNAQIWDVIIDPAFQDHGLGRQLIEEIVRHLITLDIKNITTFAEKGGTKFYEKIGFQADPDGVRGMFWRQMK